MWRPRHVGQRGGWAAAVAVVLAIPLMATATPAASAEPVGTQPTGTYYVLLDSAADVSEAPTVRHHADRARFVYETKKAHADRTQTGIKQLLTQRKVPFTAYWIVNAIKVTGTKQLVTELAGRSDVRQVVPDRSYRLVEPVRREPAGAPSEVEWNLGAVRAPDVWSAYGATGEGVVVGTIDTGAQADHPAIARQYRGSTGGTGTRDHEYSWFDPSEVCGSPSREPCDNEGHGTHVLGTILGDDGAGDQVGVAPGPPGSPPRDARRGTVRCPPCSPPGSGWSPPPTSTAPTRDPTWRPT